MKIAYVYDAVHPWETGGVQKRVWELARRLADDHDVHWYGLRYWDRPAVIKREGVTIHGVMDPPDLYVDGRRTIPEAIDFSMRLVGPLYRESFDVIDCQEFPYFPAFSAKLGSVRQDATLLLTWHEVWSEYWYEYLGWKGAFGDLVERLVARVPDVHVAVSERTRRDADHLGITNVEVVPNGVSIEEIGSISAESERLDVLFAGRFIPEKNPDVLVRAIAHLRDDHPDVRCVLVGDGPEHSAVESLVAQLGLERHVSLPGVIEDHDDLLGLMKAADVFALPSQREGFGITVLEALACGTPVVTAAHPRNAAQELVVPGETGAVCELTPEAIAAGIRRAQTEADGSDCKASARQFEWNRIVDQIEALYREAAAKDRSERFKTVERI